MNIMFEGGPDVIKVEGWIFQYDFQKMLITFTVSYKKVLRLDISIYKSMCMKQFQPIKNLKSNSETGLQTELSAT